MLATSQSKKYTISENQKRIGNVTVSDFIKEGSFYKIPFQEAPKMEVIKIGNGDYSDFDSFIISSLNDYYQKLNTPSDLETKEKMLDDYTKLYSLWTEICNKKEANALAELTDLYNKMSYGLYLLGYEDHQL